MSNANEKDGTRMEPVTRGGGGAGPNAGAGPGTDGGSAPVAHTGEGGGPTPVEPPGVVHIRVDREEVKVRLDSLTDGTLTGSEIRQSVKPPIGAGRDLFEIVPGGADRKIGDGDSVVLRDWMRFFSAPRTINPGRTG